MLRPVTMSAATRAERGGWSPAAGCSLPPRRATKKAGALGGREQPARTQNRILRLLVYREARGSQGAIGCFS
jgi:hypothetical protein